MKYEIQLSAPCGDIVPLVLVASTKAQERATAGQTPLHEPTYKGSFEGFATALLLEAKSGRLRVCDQWGRAGTADELIARAEAEGTLTYTSRFVEEPDWERLHRENKPIVPGTKVWSFSHLDLGPSVTDWTATHIGALWSTLKWLNDWGTTAGDEFALNHDGVYWTDERGILAKRMRVQAEAAVPKRLPAFRAQETAILEQLRKMGACPQALPVAPSGRPCPYKQGVRSALRYSVDVMNKAWQRLRADGRIKDAPTLGQQP